MKAVFQIGRVALCLLVLHCNAQIINTVAGNGVQGYGGDAGAAANAQLNQPQGVAADAFGNIYIADYIGCRIRKVNSSGIISTVAGNGTAGFSGDGGPSVNAQVNYPQDVAVDAAGNVYIADSNNNRIRKINTSGIITTVAGTGAMTFGGDGGPAINAQLADPVALCVDASGNIFVSDVLNNRIRKISSSGTISTLAGTGVSGFSGDGGLATSAQIDYPYGITADPLGNIYFSDFYNNRIRKVNTAGVISTVAGTGAQGFSGDGGLATSAQIKQPIGITFGGGNFYFCDNQSRIRKVDGAGIISTIAGNGVSGYSGDGGPALFAKVYTAGVSVNTAGDLYLADIGNNRIRKVTAIPTAGTELEYGASDCTIYPNPANTLVSLKSETGEVKTIVVINSSGQEMYRSDFQSDLSLDVSGLSPGIYVVSIRSVKTVTTKKLAVGR